MKYKIRVQISAGFALIVLITVALISLAANLLINRQFEKHVEQDQASFARGLAAGLTEQYDMAAREWNLDYIHGFGMYALNDGYIIRVYNLKNDIIWDAENHDMTFCHQVMSDIRLQMAKKKVGGDLITCRYDLVQDNTQIGYVEISYYSPYYSDENEFQFIRALNSILLVVGGVSLLGAVAAGILLARKIASPISKMTDVTKEISEGNYCIRFEAGQGAEEILALEHSINQMAESLQKQENIRKRMTTDVAHELRTPIANVSAQLEAIIEGVWEATPQRLKSCYEELGRISGLIYDLEELSQIENENLKLQKESVDLLELACSVKGAFENILQEKKLQCDITGNSCVVTGDKNRLHQVVYNLVSNAVKYSLEAGKIEIVVEDSKAAGILMVRDNGIGISDEELPFIFERFYRADKSRSRKTGGRGVGLAIAKAIVQAHNGKIKAESQIGAGSLFTIWLPKERAETLHDFP